MSIFDNLDLSGVGNSGGANPFSFLQAPTNFDVTPQQPQPPPQISAAPAVAALAGTALGGAGDAMSGAAPVLAASAPKQSFLQRLMAPSPDGLTFQDKLFAAGGILKGDSDSASKYLTGRRTELEKAKVEKQKLDDAKAKQDRADQMSQIFADSWNGQDFDAPGYAKKMAALKLGLSVEDQKRIADMRTKEEPLNFGVEGGADAFSPYSGTTREIVAPRVKLPPNYRLRGDGSGVEFIPGSAADPAVIEEAARARRRGAPPVGRSGAQNGYLDPPAGLVRVK